MAACNVNQKPHQGDDDVEAPLLHRLRRCSGLPAPKAFKGGQVGYGHYGLKACKPNPPGVGHLPRCCGDTGDAQGQEFTWGEVEPPASLREQEHEKDDRDLDAVCRIQSGFGEAVIVSGQVGRQTHGDADLEDQPSGEAG